MEFKNEKEYKEYVERLIEKEIKEIEDKISDYEYKIEELKNEREELLNRLNNPEYYDDSADRLHEEMMMGD